MNRTPSRLGTHFEVVENSGGRGGAEEGLEGGRGLLRRSGVTVGGRRSGRPGRRRRRRCRFLGADEAGAEDFVGRLRVRRQQAQQTAGGVAQRRVLQVRAEVGQLAQERVDLRGTPQSLFHRKILSE